MSDKKVFDFKGQQITVSWDKRLCIHVGECGQSAGELFEAGRDPWCMPDKSTPAEVAEICERCPSGALTYSDTSGKVEQAASENRVHVTYNGPLYVSGDLHINAATDEMPGTRFRAALCRCGHSANKPFCDNSHLKVNFEDYGAVGETGEGLLEKGGKLSVSTIKNGPLVLEGKLTIEAGSGRDAWQGGKAWLCRCGESANKPFCDGSHKKIGFEAD